MTHPPVWPDPPRLLTQAQRREMQDRANQATHLHAAMFQMPLADIAVAIGHAASRPDWTVPQLNVAIHALVEARAKLEDR